MDNGEVEMGAIKRLARISQLEKVRNKDIKRIIGIDSSIIYK